ncbi:hypothetical protein MAR_022285 [Mya arenaria]|uniref:Uncharacterized protein n=1 Tax=Mya arenaria TaxID=6604 RepID=A0ABY7DJR6_MYAAR|nr:hypothetical protein MAR_022285 [Mya arenaria]
MAFMHRFLCWNLRTASIITSFFALIMRLIDLLAISTEFEISQGFHTQWRSHQWRAFLASDVVCTFDHILMCFFSVFMLIQVTYRHFVMYMHWLKKYIIFYILYIFVEFCFSTFEFSYYAMNTFRLAYVVWLFLYWLGRTLVNITFVVILMARKQEIIEQTDRELRFAGEKKRKGLGYY